MIREQTAFLLFIFGISFTTNIALLVSWFRNARRLRQMENRVLGPAHPDEARGDRTERIERAVESLTAQVDQLASGQEFLNRVIAERLDKSQRFMPPAEPYSTPH